MTTGVADWKQAGNLYIWRYATPGRSRQGWHFSADPAGCASMVDLINRMVREASSRHRTLQLGAVTSAIWGLPSFGPPKPDKFDKLRIDYRPELEALNLGEIEGRLTLRLGAPGAIALKAAFTDLGIGLNDFAIATSGEKHADRWWFW